VFELTKKAIGVLLLLLCGAYANAANSDSEIQRRLSHIDGLDNKALALREFNKLTDDRSLTPSQQIMVLKSGVALYRDTDDTAGAIKVSKLLVSITRGRQFLREHADANKMLGILFYLSSDNTNALRAYRRALAIYLPLNSPLITASLHNNIGLVHAANSQFKAAMISYKKASKLYQAHGSAADRIDIYFNIAGLYSRLQQFDVAIEMLLKVISERKVINDIEGMALANGDLGNAYLSANNYLQAKFYYEKSLKHYEATQQSYFIASQSHNISEVHVLMGKTDLAKYYALRAIELGQATDNKQAYVGGLYNLAKAQFQEKLFEEANNSIELSLDLADEYHMAERTREYLGLKALIQAAQSDTITAITTFRHYVDLATNEKNRQLQAQIYKYQTQQESQTVKSRLDELKYNEDLSKLKNEANMQQRNMFFLVTIVTLLIMFFIWRRRAILDLKQQLEYQVTLRTEELEALTKELKKASLVKSQFMANMSHEIRTPLTSIIGRAQSIVHGEVGLRDQRCEVEIILDNSTHVLTILNDIIDLSRIEVNKLEMNYQIHDIHVIVEEVKQLFREQVSKKGLTFTMEHKLPMPLIVKVDRTRLKQIFINLCSNAIKFTHHGSITIGLSLDDDQQLVFKISDTGIGIKHEQLEDIFNSFSQADNSISRRFGGFGLGLCLSQQLAHMMGGRISVASVPNEGSVFTLNLPCIENNVIPATEVMEEPVLQSVLHGCVLLAEDHGDNRRLIARLLKAMGLDVIEASNGNEAIALCNNPNVDLILMDIQMPELDGIGAYNKLRAQGYAQPIIALTANAMPHEVDRYLDIGFDDFLAKPIERKRFVSTVAHYLRQSLLPEAPSSLSEVDMSDLVDDFVVSLAADYEQLTGLMQARDYASISTLAHRLSGAASMFGYNVMATLGRDIEHKIAQQQYDDADKLINMLRVMISRTSLAR